MNRKHSCHIYSVEFINKNTSSSNPLIIASTNCSKFQVIHGGSIVNSNTGLHNLNTVKKKELLEVFTLVKKLLSTEMKLGSTVGPENTCLHVLAVAVSQLLC